MLTAQNPYSGQPPTHTKSARIKVSIVEDNDSIRAGLTTLIRMCADMVLAGLFPNAESAVREIKDFSPDVVLMDIHLPGASGIEYILEIKKLLPQTQIIIFSIEESISSVFEALEAGASRYLAKNTSPERIVEAIREAHRDGSPMSGHIAQALVNSFQTR